MCFPKGPVAQTHPTFGPSDGGVPGGTPQVQGWPLTPWALEVSCFSLSPHCLPSVPGNRDPLPLRGLLLLRTGPQNRRRVTGVPGLASSRGEGARPCRELDCWVHVFPTKSHNSAFHRSGLYYYYYFAYLKEYF